MKEAAWRAGLEKAIEEVGEKAKARAKTEIEAKEAAYVCAAARLSSLRSIAAYGDGENLTDFAKAEIVAELEEARAIATAAEAEAAEALEKAKAKVAAIGECQTERAEVIAADKKRIEAKAEAKAKAKVEAEEEEARARASSAYVEAEANERIAKIARRLAKARAAPTIPAGQ